MEPLSGGYTLTFHEGELPHRRWKIPLARRRSVDDSLHYHRGCRMVLRLIFTHSLEVS